MLCTGKKFYVKLVKTFFGRNDKALDWKNSFLPSEWFVYLPARQLSVDSWRSSPSAGARW